ncbi:hypothetical protein C0991_004488 [Blastosporella zonata]|nr:hypothetical protein C0991_004488 [Blastosporella zonata]
MPANVSGTAHPSSVLADSLAALSKSAHQAFAEVENQARQDVAKANSDAREARIERDKTLEALHATQLDGQVLQKEVASVQATLKQTELSVSHLKETIAQLRREATQWKDQSRNWQEHFLRVEQERCSLSTRIEELVAERLQWTRSFPTPFTPNNPPPDEIEPVAPSKVSKTLRKHPISPPDVDRPSTTTGSHPSRTATKPLKVKHKTSTSTPLFSRNPSPPNQNTSARNDRTRKASPEVPTITVIRHVRAIIDIKPEESDGESDNFEAGAAARRMSPRKRKAIHHDGDYVSGDESDHPPLASDQSYEDDEDEQDVDDEDDELMLGAEVSYLICHGQLPWSDVDL